MKTLLSVLAIGFCLNAHADLTIEKSLRTCDAEQLNKLKASLVDWNRQGYKQSSFILNTKGETVGAYAWSKKGVHAGICEIIKSAEVAVASEWSNWDSIDYKTDPATWKAGYDLNMSHDNGIANMKIIQAAKDGHVKLKFSVWGFGPSSDVLVKEEVVTFSRAL